MLSLPTGGTDLELGRDLQVGLYLCSQQVALVGHGLRALRDVTPLQPGIMNPYGNSSGCSRSHES